MRTLLKRTLLISIFSGLALYTALLFYFIPKDSVQSNSAFIENTIALPTSEQPSIGLPVSLKIPKINLDSAVENVGLIQDGSMDIPKDISDVAWFNLGPRPGENGSAVIDGHYGIKNGKGAAFDELYKLRKGDKIYVEDDKGVTITFVVSGNRRYDPNADASGVFSSSDGKAHLNLITCEGIWDKVSEGYPQRLVVFADKE